MNYNGKKLSKKEILCYAGDISQIGGVTESTLSSGKGRGMRIINVDTGSGLEFTVMPERCMDIGWTKYKGRAIGFIAKAGISSPVYFSHSKDEFHRVFGGGLLLTCGLRNIGKYGDYEGEHFGQHGRIHDAPAENLAVNYRWEGDEYLMELSGSMREAVLYGENLYLRRKIKTSIGNLSFVIEDTIVNESFRDEYVDILYHMNFGYPLLSEGALINLPGGSNIDYGANKKWPLSTAECHIKDPAGKNSGGAFPVEFDRENVRAELLNPALDYMRGIYIAYKKSQLPRFSVWKSEIPGDYVVGLEPGTSNPEGRENNLKSGTMIKLRPMEEYKIEVEFGIIPSDD